MSNDMKQDKVNENADNGAAIQVEELPAQMPLTPAQFEELKDKAGKADEYWERLLRQAADFENFKKRAARERQEATKYANEGLLQKLIPILDNFEMALAAVPAEGGNSQLQAGVAMI